MRKSMIVGLTLAASFWVFGSCADAGGIIDDNTRDYSKFTCRDLIEDTADDIKKGKSPEESATMNMVAVVMWAHGYLARESGNTEVTLKELGGMMGAVGETCKKPSKNVIVDIIRGALGN